MPSKITLENEIKLNNIKLNNRGLKILENKLFAESLSLTCSCIDSLEDLNSHEVSFFKSEFTGLVNDYKHLQSLIYKHNLKKLKKGVKW